MADPATTILALDVGNARIGVALASRAARLASPYRTLTNDATIVDHLRLICEQEHVDQIVVGKPRNMHGDATAQTTAAESFANRLHAELNIPITWQDESLTSVHAETELKQRGKPYQKGDIDALAATYILEDYLHETL